MSTMKDFGNVLLEHKPKKKKTEKKKESSFSPWTKIGNNVKEKKYDK